MAGLATLALLAMLAVGEARPQAPDVPYVLLDGTPGRLAALRGHVVLVTFWSVDCAPCLTEMPALARAWRTLAPRGFELLAVSGPDDPPYAVAGLARAQAWPFGVVLDLDGRFGRAFGGVSVTPTTVLIDRRGRIAARWVGPVDAAQLERRADPLLRAPA